MRPNKILSKKSVYNPNTQHSQMIYKFINFQLESLRMRHPAKSISISGFSLYIINSSQINSHLTALRELVQSLFLCFLPRLLIFALFSSLNEFVSFSTHTQKKAYHSFQRFIFETAWEAVSFSLFMLISGLRQCVPWSVQDRKSRSGRITR